MGVTKLAYQASQEEHSIEITNVQALEGLVKARMEKGAFGYIAGGAEDEWTLRENGVAFDHKHIAPRVLKNIEKPDLSTTFMGIDLKIPMIAAPIAAQGLAHEQGEIDTAKGVAAVGSIMSLSTYSNKTISETCDGGTGGPQFFQLYMSKDEKFNRFLLDQAKKVGMKAIILTADSTLGGNREADSINHFTFPIPMANLAEYGEGEGQGIAAIYANAKQTLSLEDIKTISDYTDLPVFVKGIQSPLDIDDIIEAGAKGVWVSNHGGRQLDGGPASFDVLESIAKKVNKRVPIVFDSGIRRGSHIFKALASGADVVAIGRPMVYGLHLGGAQGVQSVFEHLSKELTIDMQLAGTKTVDDIKKTELI
ncbi:l-lactate oxidase [Dellaglioa algida DSM 15638]|uniref:L-lactate oxidase n=1 Tax=Dellaglioa algida DSM 15638 TaxID=1423719 RepID=A0A0R1HH70_9LACO|nr:l-lactate oxidase [Dellaglioa algida DSM 15638]